MDWISDPQIWIALLTLTTLEVVLGIDNIIFITILSGKLPASEQQRARTTGLALAMFMRIGLLFSITMIMRLVEPWFNILGREISARDVILIAGGLFLLAKATFEIHGSLEGGGQHEQSTKKTPSFSGTIIQILLLDIV